jgi:hypothetical protein
MDKQKIFRYLTIFFMLAFIGEIFVIGFGARQDTTTPSPTPVPVQTFSGQGTVRVKVTGVSSQYFANCSSVDLGIAANVSAIQGVDTAFYDASGLTFALKKQGNATNATNQTAANATTANATLSSVAALLENACDTGFTLYRVAYSVPQEKLALVNGSGGTLNLSNYSILSYAQSVSAPGIITLVDYRKTVNDTAEVVAFGEFVNGVPQRLVAQEIQTAPQASFSGTSMVRATVLGTTSHIVVSCPGANENDSLRVPSILENINGTTSLSQDAPNAYGLQVNASQMDSIIAEIEAKLSFCTPIPVIKKLGLVQLDNGTTCAGAINFSDRTEFNGTENGQAACKPFTFSKITLANPTYAGVPALLRIASNVNDTVSAQLSIASTNGRIDNVIAEEGNG